MYKDFVPPVSIEEFAAYLDGNLSDDEMQRVSSVIENDEAMQDIAVNNLSIEDALSHYESSEFTSGNIPIPIFSLCDCSVKLM